MIEVYGDLSNFLKKESVDSIEIFMNLIFEKISNLMINAGSFNDEIDVKKFESELDNIIIDSIDKYNEYKVVYLKDNYKMLEKDINELNSKNNKNNDNKYNNNYLIVKELLAFEELEDEMKYFVFTKTFNEEKAKQNYFKYYLMKKDFIKCKNKYPLLNQLLFGSDKVNDLVYLPDINNFINYLINKFSHKISRKEAKEKIITDNYLKIDANLLKQFLGSWKKASHNELSEKSVLINFLVDNKEEPENQIIKLYKNFIEIQNKFLEPIINHNQNTKGILHFYVDSLKKKINIQDSKNNHIDISKIDLDSIIKKYSKRDIFSSNNTINYTNYNTFIYDLDSIEKELGEKILPGKCLFEENELKPIIFWGEGNPEILTSFVKKYPQEKINEKEKEKIKEKIKTIYQDENLVKEFYESFQILFFYLNENKNVINIGNNLDYLLDIIPKDLNISEEFYNFLKEEGKFFKLNKIIEIYLYFEHLYFALLYIKQEEKFKNDDIDLEIINKIDNFLNKEEFFKALRRYITRYLFGNQNMLDIKDENLIKEFYKSDLWGIDQMNNFDEVKNFLDKKSKDFNVKVGEAFIIYENFGEKDKEVIKNFINEIYPDNENNVKDNNNDDNDVDDDLS